MYGKYIVEACKVKIRFINQGSLPMLCGVFPTLYAGVTNSDLDLYP